MCPKPDNNTGPSELFWHPAMEQMLKELIRRHDARKPREDGIPAVLIIDDYSAVTKKTMQPAYGDEGLGLLYSWAALALAAIIDKNGGAGDYPSICPAMSAVAEIAFSSLPFEARKTGEEESRG